MTEYDHEKGGWQTCPKCGKEEVYWPTWEGPYCEEGCYGGMCQKCGDVPGLNEDGSCKTIEAVTEGGNCGMDLCPSCFNSELNMVKMVYEEAA